MMFVDWSEGLKVFASGKSSLPAELRVDLHSPNRRILLGAEQYLLSFSLDCLCIFLFKLFYANGVKILSSIVWIKVNNLFTLFILLLLSLQVNF